MSTYSHCTDPPYALLPWPRNRMWKKVLPIHQSFLPTLERVPWLLWAHLSAFHHTASFWIPSHRAILLLRSPEKELMLALCNLIDSSSRTRPQRLFRRRLDIHTPMQKAPPKSFSATHGHGSLVWSILYYMVIWLLAPFALTVRFRQGLIWNQRRCYDFENSTEIHKSDLRWWRKWWMSLQWCWLFLRLHVLDFRCITNCQDKNSVSRDFSKDIPTSPYVSRGLLSLCIHTRSTTTSTTFIAPQYQLNQCMITLDVFDHSDLMMELVSASEREMSILYYYCSDLLHQAMMIYFVPEHQRTWHHSSSTSSYKSSHHTSDNLDHSNLSISKPRVPSLFSQMQSPCPLLSRVFA